MTTHPGALGPGKRPAAARGFARGRPHGARSPVRGKRPRWAWSAARRTAMAIRPYPVTM